jgi:dipeptidyl aminopeptidase/acylaminoacyl peptidase
MFSTDELHFHYYEMDGAPWLPESESAVLPRQAVPSDRRRWDPSVNLSRWRTPELVIHSEKDYRVTISESLALFNVLQARGIASQFLVFPDENHWVLNPENNLVWHKTVLNWINQYVGLPQFTDQDPNDMEYWGGRVD